MSAGAVLVLFVAMWEAMAGLILSLSILIGLALWKNSQRKVKMVKKAVIYGVLGAMLVLLDGLAIHDIIIAGLSRTGLEVFMLVMSVVVIGLAGWWEKRL